MPVLAQLHQRLHARGLDTIAVAMPYDRPDFVLHYSARAKLPFPIAIDPMGVAMRALDAG